MEPKVPEAAVAEVVSEGSVPAAFEPSVIAVSSPGSGAASFLASLTFLAPLAAAFPQDVDAQTKIVPVPEPLSVLALAAGVSGLARRRRRDS
ncbi:PEP-CTERM sorting domain-containing protein [bacterium]|nr:MAG: PEP-CTERM sorting domain-containing protein [bacterium]